MISLKTKTISFLNIFSFLFLALFLNVSALTPCSSVDLRTASPADVIRCGSPNDIAPTSEGRSLYDVILLIANTLAIITVFFSIIGVIVGVIYLAKSGSNKAQFEEAKGIISNSVLAFVIVASLYIIVRLILNQLGIGELAPILGP